MNSNTKPKLKDHSEEEFSARGLSVLRGDEVILRSINFVCRVGEGLLITGDNGSGKSSLLQALAGLVTIRSGKMMLAGSPWGDAQTRARHPVAWLGHQNALEGEFSIEENLRYPPWGGTTADEDVARAVKLAGLDLPQSTAVRYLSAGQRRRLALARIFCQKAALWLLDEPLAGLDATSANAWSQHILDLAQRAPVMLSSHEGFAQLPKLMLEPRN